MKPNLIVQAPVFSVSGYGAHARDIVLGLYNSGKYNISILPTQWGRTSVSDKFSIQGAEVIASLVNNRISPQAESTFVHIGLPPEVKKIKGKKVICITAGIESDRLPTGWAESCNQNLDALIVPSFFMKDLFIRSGVTIPVYVVGEGADTTIFNNTSKPPLLPSSLDTEFNFLTAGQWMPHTAITDRKGIGRLIKWFCEVFADDKKVGLVIKTMSTNVSSSDRWITEKRLRSLKGNKILPRIYLVHGDMTDLEMSRLYTDPQIHAFVSCTSGEGFGRTLLEAAVSDLPTLATGWSGHMDFMHSDLSTIFEYDLTPLTPENFCPGLLEPSMQWAIPKEVDVKRKLRRCVEGYSIAKERAIKLGAHCREKFSKEKTDKDLLDVFSEIIKPVSNIIIPGVQMEQM
jgi:glycosyltransferase involved in cell wall biosynthesis